MRSLFFFILFLSFYSSTLCALTVTTKIYDIDYGDKLSDEVLILLSTGQVVTLPDINSNLLEELQRAKEEKTWLQVIVNDDNELMRLEQAKNYPSFERDGLQQGMEKNLEGFVPSVLQNMKGAQRYFNESMKSTNETSQCFNRAHIWSYEWKIKHRFNSSKMFIFFSRRYIREEKFEWWFHVAPYLHVAIEGKIKERVMDMKYAKGPLSVGDWSKLFVKNGSQCAFVKKYSDYANYPETGLCYLMRTAMYTYWPLDIENEELNGTIKEYWVEEELKTAYLDAFNIKM